MKKIKSAIGLSLATALIGIPVVSAFAAEGDDSEALARVVNTDILPLDLANSGTSQSGYPSDAGPNSDPLNVSLLNEGLDIDLGNTTLPLIATGSEGGLLNLDEAGALSSYASSPDGQNSTASAGAVGADGDLDLAGIENGTYGSSSVHLTELLDEAGVHGLTDEIIDEMTVALGAYGSTATATGDQTTSEYVIADGQLIISSPIVGSLAGSIDAAFADAGAILDVSVGPDGALGAVADTFELNTNAGLAHIQASGGTVNIYGIDVALEEAVNSILAEPLVDSNELVSIDLTTGEIIVDMDKLGGADGLNGLTANTELFDGEARESIVRAVSEALGTISEKSGDVFTDVLNNTGLTYTIPAQVSALGSPPANVDIVVDTTFGQLAGTSEGEPTIGVDGDLLGINIEIVLSAITPPVNNLLITPSQGVVGVVIDTATSGLTDNLDSVISPVIDTLSPVLSGVLTHVVEIVINEQPEPGYLGDESFTVNAISLELLPALGSVAVDVDLGSSTVRVSENIVDASIEVNPGTVQDGETTTVVGKDYPGNTDVVVQLVDPSGTPVGDSITITTDEIGGFTTDLIVLEGSEAGDYTVDATAITGETSTTDLIITNNDDPAADNDSDNTGDTQTDNTTDNTEVNTDDNTDINTDINTDDNSADNTEVNTDINTDDNTEVNTADNTSENTDVNTSDNTDVNTEANNADNTSDNTDVNTDDNSADNTSDNNSDNVSENTEINTSDNTDINTEVNTEANNADNTEVNTTDNTEANTDVNTEVNTADNTETNTDVNTDTNTEINSADNTDVNTDVNTADNSADNTSDNTADNTAVAEIGATPNRVVKGEDNVLIQGMGYTPNGTAEVYLKPVNGGLLGRAFDGFIGLFGVKDPGEFVNTVEVDANGEISFRLPSSEYELGDYTTTVIDVEDNRLSDSTHFTVVPADADAETPVVEAQVPAINADLEDGKVGNDYKGYIFTNVGQITDVSNLPEGLTFDTENNIVEGVPTKEGTFEISITAVNEDKDYTIIEIVHILPADGEVVDPPVVEPPVDDDDTTPVDDDNDSDNPVPGDEDKGSSDDNDADNPAGEDQTGTIDSDNGSDNESDNPVNGTEQEGVIYPVDEEGKEVSPVKKVNSGEMVGNNVKDNAVAYVIAGSLGFLLLLANLFKVIRFKK